MIPLKPLLLSILAVNVLILILSFAYNSSDKRELPSLDEISDMPETKLEPQKPEYSFTNPSMAYKILSQFDVYNYKWGTYTKPRIPTSTLGFKMDDHYCDKHRAFFVDYPQNAFETINIVHAWAKGEFVANTMASVANDLHSHIMKTTTRKQREKPLFAIKPETNIFFTSKPMGIYLNITKHASCLFQESNQIPGQTKLAVKDSVARASKEYVEKYKDRPQCVSYDKYFPETWLLTDRLQCKEFFKKLLSPKYAKLKQERKIVYMKKIPDSHRGEGVQPLDTEEEIKLKEQYKNGTLCGKVKQSLLMQNYIHNSLLLHGHKFDFRMYLLIASTNPLMAYYHDGFLRVTLAEYDANSNDKKVLLTNLALNKQIYDDVSKGNLYQGKDMEELKLAQQWSMERLQWYLLAAGVIKDPNWLDNYLRPEFKKAMIHLVRLSADNFARHSSFYGLYGVDFMLDTNLNLWFIEANSGPAFDGYSEPMGKFISKMLIDHLEVVTGLLRSRMKRAIDFVNNLIEDRMAYERAEGDVVIKNFEKNRQVWDNITANYFEDEFKVKEGNGFSKIVDETEQGLDVYQGLIDVDCLEF